MTGCGASSEVKSTLCVITEEHSAKVSWYSLSIERQKDLTTSHLHTQLEPLVSGGLSHTEAGQAVVYVDFNTSWRIGNRTEEI